MLFSHTFDSFAVACLLYGTFVGLPSAQAAPQLDKRAVLNVNLGARALVGDTSCPAVDSSGGLTGRVFAVVSLAEQGTVSTLNTRLADITANVQTCICVTAGVAVGNIVPSSSLNAQAIADVKAAAQTSVGAALSGLLSNPLNVLSVTLTPTAAAPCGSCLPNQQPGCASGVCSCTDCPTGQFYSASRGQCVVSPSPLARARVKARSEALAAELDMRCSGGAKNSKCNQPRDVLHMRQATREAVVERYNRTLTNNARKPVRYQRLELVSQ